MDNVMVSPRADFGDLFRTAFAAHPSHALTRRRLARYLLGTNALEELVLHFSPAVDEIAADSICLHSLGVAALALGDDTLAERALSRAAAGGHFASLGPLALALKNLQRTADAFEVAMQALQRFPTDDAANQVAFNLLLAEHRYADVWDLCMRLRAAGVWSARAVSALALAARTPDQIELVRQVTDRGTWVSHTKDAFEARFIAALARSLKERISWTPLPKTKATLGSGRRIERLHEITGNPLLSEFFAHIHAAIASYIDVRGALLTGSVDEQPMVANRPNRATLDSWAIAVNMHGHETWHVHPSGWLSGVFYLEVPDLSSSDSSNAGQIEFGPYPLGPALRDDVWPAWKVQPRTGDLLMFPSYFAHRTWPSHIAQDRICIAFDVLKRGCENTISTRETPHVQPGFGLDDRVVRHARALSAPDAAGCQLVMNVDSGECLALDEAGALVWTLLQEPRSIRQMTGALREQFDGVEAKVARDVSRVLEALAARGLVSFNAGGTTEFCTPV